MLLLLLNLYYALQTATNEGPWLSHYEQLSSVSFDDEQATIHNFRRARYNETGEIVSIEYSDRIVNLNQLQSLWYGISIFAAPGLAHTFVSFDFGDQDPVVISVEARMRPAQAYDPLWGLFDQYHLIYVFADERDVIGLRTHRRNEEVRFMPIFADQNRIRKMFVDMANRANQISLSPEFYNTLTSNCTNNIMQQTEVSAWRYYLDPRIVLPGFSDHIAYEFGVLDQRYSLQQIRQAATIRAATFSDMDDNFYSKIRDNYFQQLRSQ